MSDPASGAAGWAASKLAAAFWSSPMGVAAAKWLAMFAGSSFGAGVIAAFHAETRRETFWRALGGGFGGVFIGPLVCQIASHAWPWIFTGNTWDDIRIAAAILVVFGALFWGLVGALQVLSKRIADKGGDKIADRVGL